MASFYNSQCSAGSAAYTQGFPDLTIPAFTDMDPFLTNTGPILDPYEANRDFADDSSLYLYSIQEECMLPHYSRICSSAMFPQASYATSSALKLLHTDRGEFTLHGSHIVKSGSASPIGPATIYSGALYATTEFAEAASSPFPTSVDTLLKAIQAKQITSPRQQEVVKVEEPKVSQKPRKRYQCYVLRCGKSFKYKSHSIIHAKVHTGAKPFKCNAPDCKEMFSQKCNLNRHKSLHTREHPYSCDVCGKTFARRDNLRSHKIVHQQVKPFACTLDYCGKFFTQLRNLKSHQNKFHAAILSSRTQRFATINTGDCISPADKELWEYFAPLQKNSHKGIKGRGKGRKVSPMSPPASAPHSPYTGMSDKSIHQNYLEPYQQHDDYHSSCYVSVSTDKYKQLFERSHDSSAPIQAGYATYNTAYDNLVFPERRMY